MPAAAQDSLLQFVFTSDVHYGITRAHFRGADKVSAVTVNRAMIAAINRLPARMLPQDGGVNSGKTVGHIDGILITGDIANRQETGIQPVAASWQQFEADYDHRVITTDRFHQPTPLLLTPGNHGIDSTSKFENLLPEMFQDGQSVKDSTLIEQRQLAEFLKRHPQIKAYFHGHNNWTQFYQWHGPDNNISLPCFRVDSPMKGKPSATDETLISFELITIDPGKKSMTVREYQWNPVPGDPSVTKWGQTMTIDLL